SIAALPAWNSLSASTPVRPVGEICLFRIKSDQYFTAPTEFGESINAFFPSADTTSPPLPQSRIDHTGTANRSGNTTPYWSGRPSAPGAEVSLTASAAHSAHVLGGTSGLSPAFLKRSLFQ